MIGRSEQSPMSEHEDHGASFRSRRFIPLTYVLLPRVDPPGRPFALRFGFARTRFPMNRLVVYIDGVVDGGVPTSTSGYGVLPRIGPLTEIPVPVRAFHGRPMGSLGTVRLRGVLGRGQPAIIRPCGRRCRRGERDRTGSQDPGHHRPRERLFDHTNSPLIRILWPASVHRKYIDFDPKGL